MLNISLRLMIFGLIPDVDIIIYLVIDLHCASNDGDFDIEFGPLDNLSTNELEDLFKYRCLNYIIYNAPFKGGVIT